MKTNEQLLLAYRKANKEARKRILEKSGFATEATYIDHLMNSDSNTIDPEAFFGPKLQEKEVKPIIHNVHIVDVSGSMMGGKLTSAVQGVNDEVEELKKDKTVTYTHSLVEFSGPNQIKTVAWKVPINEVKRYSTRTVDMTALNQAVGETLERLVKEANNDDKVLVKIFTDGGENASMGKYRTHQVLREFITECENKGFTITFIGTARDVQFVVQNLNIDASNTYTHDNTSQGVYMAAVERGIATKLYSEKVKKGEDVKKGFFKSVK